MSYQMPEYTMETVANGAMRVFEAVKRYQPMARVYLMTVLLLAVSKILPILLLRLFLVSLNLSVTRFLIQTFPLSHFVQPSIFSAGKR